MTGLVPVISIQLALPCHGYRDCRVKPGNDGVRKPSRDAVHTRVIVTCTKETTKAFALRTDLRQRMPAVAAATLTIRALSHECKNRKQGSGTPRDAYPASAPERGAARAERCALAFRRPTTALAAANERHSSTPATRFLGRD